MKKTLIILLSIVLCTGVLFAACEDNQYVGKYTHVDTDIQNNRIIHSLRLEKGGKCSYFSLEEGLTEDNLPEEVIFRGTYKVKDNKITLTFYDPINFF